MIVRKTTDDMAANTNAMLGLSGLDTASMLKAMMKPYKTPISSLSQKQQIVVWRQERYRELIGKLNDFKAKFFDYRTPATNITSPGTWKKFNVDNPGDEYVKISSTGTSKPKTGTIELLQMPVGSKIKGHTELTKDVEGVIKPDWKLAAGSFLYINMDGIERAIRITDDMAPAVDNHPQSVALLQDAIDAAFGAGAINVSLTPTEFLLFTAGPSVNQFRIFDGSMSTARTDLGFGGDANLSNKVVLSDTLGALNVRLKSKMNFIMADVNDGNGNIVSREVVEFSINETNFRFTRFNSIKSVMDTINSSGCGAKLTYDNKLDQFTLTADICGPGDTLRLKEDTTTFFEAIGLLLNNTTLPVTATFDGGKFDDFLADKINDSNSASPPVPYVYNVTINGVTKKIVLTGTGYSNINDVLDDFNAQLITAFPDFDVILDTVPAPSPATWDILSITFSNSGPDPVRSISITADPSAPANAMDGLGLTALMANVAVQYPGYERGVFGKVVIDGVILQVDRPVFETDGVLYDLKKAPPPGYGPIIYSIKTDTDKIVELVRNFVEAYNELVREIGKALGEKRDKDYLPLTDEQRDQMNEKEIERWEAKAKSGVLRGDMSFVGLSTKLRIAVFNPIFEKFNQKETIPYSLKKMGIDTKDALKGYNPSDYGALYVDEAILRQAIETNLDQIARLFTKEPEKYVPGAEDAGKPASWNARMQRLYNEKTGGVAIKMVNVLDDYVRTLRGSNNAKGVLIERAGVENDASDLYNALSLEIMDYEKRIKALWERYDRIEKQKIRVLSRLESIVSSSASQIEWMQGQMGQQR